MQGKTWRTTKQGHIDYKETYSPVVDTNSIRLLLVLAAQESIIVKSFYINIALLHDGLQEDLNRKVPEGWCDAKEKVCTIKKPHCMDSD